MRAPIEDMFYPEAGDEDSKAVRVCLLEVREGGHGGWTQARDGGKRLNFRVLRERTMDRTTGTRAIALPFRQSDTRASDFPAFISFSCTTLASRMLGKPYFISTHRNDVLTWPLSRSFSQVVGALASHGPCSKSHRQLVCGFLTTAPSALKTSRKLI